MSTPETISLTAPEPARAASLPAPARPGLIAAIRELVQARDLVWSWTYRMIRARYQQSWLGWLWALVQPAAQALIFAVIFTHIVRIDTGGVPYVLFSYAAITAWTFLSTALTDMSNAVADNLPLVTKIYFPRETLPLAAMLARLFDFAIANMLLAVLLIWYRVPLQPAQLLLVPAVLVVELALVVGIGLAAAAANVFVRDVRPLTVLVLQVWFYASPIIYPVSAVPARYRQMYSFNPAVGIIEAYRSAWLNTPFPFASLANAAIAAVTMLALGYWIFKRSERLFADLG